MAIKFVSAANVRTYLNFTSTNQDTLIEELIEQVSDDIQNYCDRKFPNYATNVVEYPKGGGPYLHLKYFPIAAITDIRYDEDRIFGSDSIVSSDDYVWDEELKNQGLVFKDVEFGINLRSGVTPNWPHRPDVIKVTYQGGYSLSAGVIEVPSDLKKATIMQVAYLMDRRKSLGVSSASGADGSLNFGSIYGFLPQVQRVVENYRRIVVV